MNRSKNTVLITGGSTGIGLSLANKFLQEDNTVIITGRDKAKLQSAQASHPNLIIKTADMSDPLQIKELVNEFPNVNILVNNAGIQINEPFDSRGYSSEMIREELDINLIGPLLLTKFYLPLLHKAKNGAAIINVSSGLGIVPKESAPVYCASKAGIHIFTRALRWQLEMSNIKVFELIPPLVDTNMTKGRGTGKISVDQLSAEFWHKFTRGHLEIQIGKVKLLTVINRLLPGLADRIMRK